MIITCDIPAINLSMYIHHFPNFLYNPVLALVFLNINFVLLIDQCGILTQYHDFLRTHLNLSSLPAHH